VSAGNTLFLRLEGPLQAWGDPSKFLIRRTLDAPTKSGVLGILCCAMGLSRKAARERLPELTALTLGIRIDRRGIRWWDYHSVGAGTGMTTAAGGVKTGAQGTMITRREYLADGSYLVALQGDEHLVHEIASALAAPRWPLFLGRRSCPPSVPIYAIPREGEVWSNPGTYEDLPAALKAVPWCPRYQHDTDVWDGSLVSLVEWLPKSGEEMAPDDAEIWYDAPMSFDPPSHIPRFVLRGIASPAVGRAMQAYVPAERRARADYRNSEYRKRRRERIDSDHGLCVFCKSPATTVQHITYRRAGGQETLEDLRALCRLCHDAVTMIEYGLGMGLDRIDPVEARWRDQIRNKRLEIIQYRSLETRRRALQRQSGEED